MKVNPLFSNHTLLHTTLLHVILLFPNCSSVLARKSKRSKNMKYLLLQGHWHYYPWIHAHLGLSPAQTLCSPKHYNAALTNGLFHSGIIAHQCTDEDHITLASGLSSAAQI